MNKNLTIRKKNDIIIVGEEKGTIDEEEKTMINKMKE